VARTLKNAVEKPIKSLNYKILKQWENHQIANNNQESVSVEDISSCSTY
jgi:hypothetical protein